MNFWGEIQHRKAKELNLINHTGSLLIAIDQADKQQVAKLDKNKWLPFDLEEKDSGISIDPSVAQLLMQLRDRDELPPMMLRDLYKNKLIEPG